MEENKISKYLTLPEIPIKPTNKATTSTHQTEARIVTSQQFLEVLREKEEKEKQLRRKKLRKLERERERKEKELQKEAVQKRKEERLLAKRTVKTSKFKTTTLKKSVSKTLPQTASKTITSKQTKHTIYLESSSESEVDDQTCCVCFGEYHDDEEWVRCCCGRWLYEDCTLNDEPSALKLCAQCVL